MASLNGDTFIDILEDRRKSSDVAWVSRSWDCTSCRYSMNRSPQEIKQEVLTSQRVQSVIREEIFCLGRISSQNGKSEEEVQEMAKRIVEEMGHNFQLKAIRLFGFILSKLMKRLYGSILVNSKGLEKIRSISSQYPILLMPTHRSYADFLLVSYICFHFNLPVPVIAAGLDFLGLKAVSSLLRNSGAFFIRRSFIADRLYWEIFSEYVQTHIQGCEYPLEFFIEGTRSRTAKSLVPKLGMLQVVMELFFSSRIPDITIVPISMSYDRTLEETLYAYELLGVPKPKESTKGLFKARKILDDHFGNVYVRFGEPLSVRQFFRIHNRSIHNLHPRNVSYVTKDEQILCTDLANHIVRTHQCNLLLSPFPLICVVIGHPHALKMKGVHFDHLVDTVFWLKELVQRTGATIYLGNNSLPESIKNNLKIHSNIVQVSPEFIVSSRDCQIEQSQTSAPTLRLHHNTLKYALPEMFIYHYGNQVVQLLVHVAMISMAMLDGENSIESQDSIFFRYKILRKVLQKEFVFERLKAEEDFTHALQSLKEEGIIVIRDSKIISAKGAVEKLSFLQRLLLHFLNSYYVICQHLLTVSSVQDSCQALVRQCQSVIERAISNRDLEDYKTLSLDIINNCITLLVSRGSLRKEQKEKKLILIPSHSELSSTLAEIEMFLPPSNKVQLSSINIATVAAAKL